MKKVVIGKDRKTGIIKYVRTMDSYKEFDRSEEELDKLANEYVGSYGCEDYDDGVEAYKAGYRKAMEERQ